MQTILNEAVAKGYAVGSFNVVSLDSLQGILEAATQLRSPVILSVAEVHFKYIDLEYIVPVIKQAAAQAPIPVALHLDHGVSLEAVMRCFRLGFTSLMFDGSNLPYEENVARTAEIVRVAHSVESPWRPNSAKWEAERVPPRPPKPIGRCSPIRNRPSISSAGRVSMPWRWLSVPCTGCIRASLNWILSVWRPSLGERGVPLVLHGGSGIPDEDIKRAISLGIAKINVYTEMSMQAVQRIREKVADPKMISFPDLLLLARQGIKETVMDKISVFGSANVCQAPGVFCDSCGACVMPSGDTCAASAPSTNGLAALSDEEIARMVASVVRGILSLRD